MIYIIIGVIILLVLCVLIILFARKASSLNSNPASGSSSRQQTQTLTQEQTKLLTDANSQLTNVRMLFSRVQDPQIGQIGTKTCSSVEKVLQTLKEKPEKIQTSRQLMNYYLPTMEKVITRYERMESGKVETEEIQNSLKTYLGDVDTAMQRMYEGLYDNDKLLTEVDMEAMTLAIKRDGLLED